MQGKTTRILFDYWNSVRGERFAPRRFEIEPSRIASILPDTFILERLDAGSYRYRLAGTRYCEHFAAECRGASFLEGWSAGDRGVLRETLATVATRGACALLTVDAEGNRNSRARLEYLVLPLLHVGQSIDRFLGAACRIDGEAATIDERLSGRTIAETELIWPETRREPVAPPRETLNLSVYRQQPFLPHIRTARIVRQDRRQFRVYDGGLSLTGRDKP